MSSLYQERQNIFLGFLDNHSDMDYNYNIKHEVLTKMSWYIIYNGVSGKWEAKAKRLSPPDMGNSAVGPFANREAAEERAYEYTKNGWKPVTD